MFPVAGDNSYTDDFGDARHQGRHEGIDIMADRGTPLVAVADARVIRLSRTETGLGGISLWLERADGTQYYYAHMTTIADGLAEGTKVAVGQVVGTVGNTGDARYGAPHLHFEIHPGGGSATNPYPHLVAVDPDSSDAGARHPVTGRRIPAPWRRAAAILVLASAAAGAAGGRLVRALRRQGDGRPSGSSAPRSARRPPGAARAC